MDDFFAEGFVGECFVEFFFPETGAGEDDGVKVVAFVVFFKLFGDLFVEWLFGFDLDPFALDISGDVAEEFCFGAADDSEVGVFSVKDADEDVAGDGFSCFFEAVELVVVPVVFFEGDDCVWLYGKGLVAAAGHVFRPFDDFAVCAEGVGVLAILDFLYGKADFDEFLGRVGFLCCLDFAGGLASKGVAVVDELAKVPDIFCRFWLDGDFPLFEVFLDYLHGVRSGVVCLKVFTPQNIYIVRDLI